MKHDRIITNRSVQDDSFDLSSPRAIPILFIMNPCPGSHAYLYIQNPLIHTTRAQRARPSPCKCKCQPPHIPGTNKKNEKIKRLISIHIMTVIIFSSKTNKQKAREGGRKD